MFKLLFLEVTESIRTHSIPPRILLSEMMNPWFIE